MKFAFVLVLIVVGTVKVIFAGVDGIKPTIEARDAQIEQAIQQ